MSVWVTDGVPVFAVVGKVNMGKSSVLATLLEVDNDKVIRVSATPGETTRCQVLPLEFDGEEWIRFVDTPGFMRPIEAMREIQEIQDEELGGGTPGLEAVKHFLDKYRESGEFEDECELLGPLVEGAGILYIVDPSKPLRDAFVAEMEILRWTGRERMALLNEKADTDPKEVKAWKERLGSYFNLVRTFNAHEAKFDERRRLLRSLLEIDESHAQRIERTIQYLDDEWRQRREESVEVIVSTVEKALMLRESRVLDERDLEVEHRRERVAKEMATVYYEKVGKLAEKGANKLLKIYRHHLVELDWDEFQFEVVDLEAEETWSKWGLSRSQLAIAGGVAGATAGAAVDIGSGGLTHGVGTLIGVIGGAAAAFFKGDELPDLKVDVTGGMAFKGGEGRSLELGPPKNDNFPWILLDRLMVAYRGILSRAHGKRDKELLKIVEAEAGLVRSLKGEDRRTLGKWMESCAKGSPDRALEPRVFKVMVEALGKVEEVKD